MTGSFVEMNCFLRNGSLEFHEIRKKKKKKKRSSFFLFFYNREKREIKDPRN